MGGGVLSVSGVISKLELSAVIYPMSSARENKVTANFKTLEDEVATSSSASFSSIGFLKTLGGLLKKEGWALILTR